VRVRPLAAGRPRVQSDQTEVAANLVDEHEPGRVDPRGPRAPGRPGSLVLLAGTQGLFFESSQRVG
jgi:hypothetical protein